MSPTQTIISPADNVSGPGIVPVPGIVQVLIISGPDDWSRSCFCLFPVQVPVSVLFLWLGYSNIHIKKAQEQKPYGQNLELYQTAYQSHICQFWSNSL